MDKSSIHYKILNYKYLPLTLRRLIFISMNWFFQGILYMDHTEKTFKFMLTIVPTLLLILIFYYFYPIEHPMITSFFLAHSFNWIFNGHIFGLIRHFDITKNEPQRFIDYANMIKIRVSNEESLCLMAVYGSLSRNKIKPTSDLDVRIIRKPGFVNGFKACIFGFKERSRALFNKFPLDIYVIDSTKHLLKIRDDEKPQLLYDPNNLLGK